MEKDNTVSKNNRVTIKTLFQDFMQAIEVKSPSAVNYLATDAKGYFSHLGDFNGGHALVEALIHQRLDVDYTRFKVVNQYVAIADNLAKQSGYILALFANDTGEEVLDNFQFGGHFTSTYELVNSEWKMSELRFYLDWEDGDRKFVPYWKAPEWPQKTPVPKILSEIDSPWRAILHPSEWGTDEEQIIETYIRYAWGLDQQDIDLMKTAFAVDAKANMSPFGYMEGQREIVSLLKIMRNGHPYLQHAADNFKVKVNGDTASMEIFRIVPFSPTKETINAKLFAARYESRLRKHDGQWQFEWLEYIPGWTTD